MKTKFSFSFCIWIMVLYNLIPGWWGGGGVGGSPTFDKVSDFE